MKSNSVRLSNPKGWGMLQATYSVSRELFRILRQDFRDTESHSHSCVLVPRNLFYKEAII